MERYVIDQLAGVNINDVEGVSNSPSEVKNLTFRRRGGYVPLGGRNQSWLPASGDGNLLDETPNLDNLLYENGEFISSEWTPTIFLDNAELITYDEGNLAFFSNGQVWLNNSLNTLSIPEIANETRVSLVPKTGLIAPWRRVDGDYVGGALFNTLDRTWTTGSGAGTLSFVEAGSSGIPAATYEFVWAVESPTDAGLIVNAVDSTTYNVASAITSLTITTSLTFPEGTVLRFYYRDSTADPVYERFATAVSNGLDPISVVLEDLGTFVPTEEVLVNFGPGRLESHNERVWGVASERSFVPFLPSSALTRSEGYMLVSGGNLSDTRQYGTVALANMGLRADGDYIEMVIPRLRVNRTRRDKPIVVELFSNQKSGSTNEDLFGYLQWDVDASYPRLIVKFAVDASTSYTLVDSVLELSQFSLGKRINSERTISSITLNIELDTFVLASPNGLGTTAIYSVQAENMPAPFIANVFQIADDAWTAWGTYSTAAATTLAVGRLPAAHVPDCVKGIRELRVSKIETGSTIGSVVYSLGLVSDYDPSVSLTTWTSSGTNAETWTTASSSNMIVNYFPTDTAFDPNPLTNPELTIVFSDIGSVNRGTALNFIQMSALTSNKITALSSTPAGLLVFLENETFLVRGDPALGDLSVQRLSGTVGCDDNVIPARLGSVVMPIYKGEVYAINLGGGDVDFGSSLANVSSPVWIRDDWFVQVAGENYRNQIVGITDDGKAYRLDLQSQQWLTDLFSEVSDLRNLMPACNCNTYGTRYYVAGYLEVVDDDLMQDPVLTWNDMDLGDKNLQKLWRRIEVMTGDSGVGTPTLTYSIRGATSSVVGLDQGDGRWVFTLPRGLVGPKADLEFTFVDATTSLVVEPPVVIEFQPRYRER